MTALDLDRLRREGQEFTEAVAQESYLAHSGHKRTAELAPIYESYRNVLGPEALDLTTGMFKDAPPASENRRSARYLLEWQVESQAARAVVDLEEREIEWERGAVVEVGEVRSIPYQRAPIEIANTRDWRERHAIDDARARLTADEHAPLRLERLQREKAYIEALGIADDYNSTFESLTDISLEDLRRQCAQFLSDTLAMWDDTLPFFLRKSLGITPAEATRADALALLRGSEFDGSFPASGLEPAIRRNAGEMAIDCTAAGRIVFDLEEREGKSPRAFCAPVQVPGRVYLVLRPHGGLTDYTTFLHELGHALHFGYADPHYPFEFRWLGDNSVTEGFAMLFDHRMQDEGWLQRYTGIGRGQLGDFVRMAAFEELHFLRRYCAKLIYEVEVYSGATPWAALPDLYVETLTAATTFQYRAADAFVDLDPRFYSSRYLRAWQLQSLIADELKERFNEDWYRNPGVGSWMIENLFSEGQRETATELAARISGAPLSFGPLARAIERGLTSAA